MTEAAVAPVAAQHGHVIFARSRRNRLNPLEALECGFALFRSTFGREAWRYYAGAAPLALCFIPMWVVDGQVRISNGALLIEAVLLAGAYLLRVWAVGRYMHGVRESAFGVAAARPAGLAAKAAALGRVLAWKLTLSAAALAALPTFGGTSWFYSACQFASFEASEDAAERHSIRDCLALASQWFGGGLLLFLMLFPLWIAVWLNSLMLAIIFPQLLHSIFGVNTLLSTEMGVYALVSSSAFWLSLFGGAWLALDPVVKCTFVVVYQHLRSRREGDDLRGLLASLPRERKKKAEMIVSAGDARAAGVASLLILVAILLGSSQASARSTPAPPSRSAAETAADSTRQKRVQELRQALDEESKRAIYRWHDSEHLNPPTWLDKELAKIGAAIQRAWEAFYDFLRKLWPSGLRFSPAAGGAWRLKDLRLWLALVAGLTLTVGATLFWLRRRYETPQLSIPVSAAPLPGLLDAAVASERSEDEWFALANRLEGEGHSRLALRAAYLGLLAGLAQRAWLTIRRDRTNREYLDEFTRRWRRRPQAAVEARAEIPEKLRGSLRQFDRVWYGSHAPTPESVAAYRQAQRELLDHV
ncbi:MAG: DUF4129 domain-containing protein [Candidatus Acidiferrales bacterium]